MGVGGEELTQGHGGVSGAEYGPGHDADSRGGVGPQDEFLFAQGGVVVDPQPDGAGGSPAGAYPQPGQSFEQGVGPRGGAGPEVEVDRAGQAQLAAR